MDFFSLYTPDIFDFANQDIDATILYYLHNDVEPLMEQLNQRVKDRTASRTGSLREDELFEVNYDFLDPVLARMYTSGINEMDTYGRTYERFIEGPSLGFSSPTITDPSHMYARIETEDIELIQAWGEEEMNKIAAILEERRGLTGT